MTSSISDSVLKAMNIIADKSSENNLSDTTVKATTIRCLNAQTGQYLVSYNNGEMYAYDSFGVGYQPNTQVYVLIPNGVMTNKKLILGAVSTDDGADNATSSLTLSADEVLSDYNTIGINVATLESANETTSSDSDIIENNTNEIGWSCGDNIYSIGYWTDEVNQNNLGALWVCPDPDNKGDFNEHTIMEWSLESTDDDTESADEESTTATYLWKEKSHVYIKIDEKASTRFNIYTYNTAGYSQEELFAVAWKQIDIPILSNELLDSSNESSDSLDKLTDSLSYYWYCLNGYSSKYTKDTLYEYNKESEEWEENSTVWYRQTQAPNNLNNLISLDTDSLNINMEKADALLVKSDFRTNLDEDNHDGNYGMIIALEVIDDNTQEETTVSYTLDTSNMDSDPMNYINGSTQYKICKFEGASFSKIVSITLFSYGFSSNYSSMKDSDVFLSNFEIYALSQDVSYAGENNEYQLIVSTPNGNIFISDDGTDKITATAKLYYSNVDISSDATFYWGKRYGKNQVFNSKLGSGYSYLESKGNGNEISFDISECQSYENEYKCAVSYKNDISLSNNFTIFNRLSKYNIVLTSDCGTGLLLRSGCQPTITCKVIDSNSDEEISQSFFTFNWSINDEEVIDSINNNYYSFPQGLHGYQLKIAKWSSLNENLTVHCFVYDENSNLVGKKDIIFKNIDSNLYQNCYLSIKNGSQVFQYSENGLSPTNSSLESPLTVLDPEMAFVDPDTNEEIAINSDKTISFYWIVPSTNTLIVSPSNSLLQTVNEEVRYYNQSFPLEIADTYNINYINNQLIAVLEYKGKSYRASTNFLFTKIGENGTNGTTSVVKISTQLEPDNSEEILTLWTQNNCFSHIGDIWYNNGTNTDPYCLSGIVYEKDDDGAWKETSKLWYNADDTKSPSCPQGSLWYDGSSIYIYEIGTNNLLSWVKTEFEIDEKNTSSKYIKISDSDNEIYLYAKDFNYPSGYYTYNFDSDKGYYFWDKITSETAIISDWTSDTDPAENWKLNWSWNAKGITDNSITKDYYPSEIMPYVASLYRNGVQVNGITPTWSVLSNTNGKSFIFSMSQDEEEDYYIDTESKDVNSSRNQILQVRMNDGDKKYFGYCNVPTIEYSEYGTEASVGILKEDLLSNVLYDSNGTNPSYSANAKVTLKRPAATKVVWTAESGPATKTTNDSQKTEISYAKPAFSLSLSQNGQGSSMVEETIYTFSDEDLIPTLCKSLESNISEDLLTPFEASIKSSLSLVSKLEDFDTFLEDFQIIIDDLSIAITEKIESTDDSTADNDTESTTTNSTTDDTESTTDDDTESTTDDDIELLIVEYNTLLSLYDQCSEYYKNLSILEECFSLLNSNNLDISDIPSSFIDCFNTDFNILAITYDKILEQYIEWPESINNIDYEELAKIGNPELLLSMKSYFLKRLQNDIATCLSTLNKVTEEAEDISDEYLDADKDLLLENDNSYISQQKKYLENIQTLVDDCCDYDYENYEDFISSDNLLPRRYKSEDQEREWDGESSLQMWVEFKDDEDANNIQTFIFDLDLTEGSKQITKFLNFSDYLAYDNISGTVTISIARKKFPKDYILKWTWSNVNKEIGKKYSSFNQKQDFNLYDCLFILSFEQSINSSNKAVIIKDVSIYSASLNSIVKWLQDEERDNKFKTLKAALVSSSLPKFEPQSEWLNQYKLYLKEKKSDESSIYVIPNNSYDNIYHNNNVVAKIYDRIGEEEKLLAKVTIPIYFKINAYELSTINGWDGTSININEDSNSILAPQVGAGVKDDSDNTFTGIVIGSLLNQDSSGYYSDEKVGLIGLHKGQQSILLDANTGKAEFGIAGSGQIIINPTGTSSISNWEIKENWLKSGSGDTTVGLSSYSDGTGSSYAVWAGASDPKDAPFSVTHSGEIVATKLTTVGGDEGLGKVVINPGTLAAYSSNSTEPYFRVTPSGLEWISKEESKEIKNLFLYSNFKDSALYSMPSESNSYFNHHLVRYNGDNLDYGFSKYDENSNKVKIKLDMLKNKGIGFIIPETDEITLNISDDNETTWYAISCLAKATNGSNKVIDSNLHIGLSYYDPYAITSNRWHDMGASNIVSLIGEYTLNYNDLGTNYLYNGETVSFSAMPPNNDFSKLYLHIVLQFNVSKTKGDDIVLYDYYKQFCSDLSYSYTDQFNEYKTFILSDYGDEKDWPQFSINYFSDDNTTLSNITAYFYLTDNEDEIAIDASDSVDSIKSCYIINSLINAKDTEYHYGFYFAINYGYDDSNSNKLITINNLGLYEATNREYCDYKTDVIWRSTLNKYSEDWIQLNSKTGYTEENEGWQKCQFLFYLTENANNKRICFCIMGAKNDGYLELAHCQLEKISGTPTVASKASGWSDSLPSQGITIKSQNSSSVLLDPWIQIINNNINFYKDDLLMSSLSQNNGLSFYYHTGTLADMPALNIRNDNNNSSKYANIIESGYNTSLTISTLADTINNVQGHHGYSKIELVPWSSIATTLSLKTSFINESTSKEYNIAAIDLASNSLEGSTNSTSITLTADKIELTNSDNTTICTNYTFFDSLDPISGSIGIYKPNSNFSKMLAKADIKSAYSAKNYKMFKITLSYPNSSTNYSSLTWDSYTNKIEVIGTQYLEGGGYINLFGSSSTSSESLRIYSGQLKLNYDSTNKCYNSVTVNGLSGFIISESGIESFPYLAISRIVGLY